MIIKNKRDEIFLLIDTAITSDMNVIQKEAKKKLRCKNVNIEIQRMWNMKCFIIPVIIGATGIVTKGQNQCLETIPGQYSIDSLQKQLRYDMARNKESATF
jgi:CRISPR/Cas system type I-B associated protein Csh2 (Cas7 group RAMP superfamily)